MKEIKEILLGSLLFIMSCIILTIMFTITENIAPSLQHNIWLMILEVTVTILVNFLFIFLFVFLYNKSKKGYLILAIIPFAIIIFLTPLSIVLWVENKDIYTICADKDTKEFCQCKLDFIRNNFPKNSQLLEKIDFTSPSRNVAYVLKGEDGKLFLKGENECRKKVTSDNKK